MKRAINQPSPSKFWTWFNPLGRQMGGWGFILNRITGLGLTLYLFMHLIVLGTLARGANAYDSFIALAHNPLFMVGEFLVVAAGFIHGLNGIRIVLNSLGLALPYQKTLLIVLMILAVLASVFFGLRMFTV
jgi:succinate dehydrogenase / fumarate reductase, cytochrome b subunit